MGLRPPFFSVADPDREWLHPSSWLLRPMLRKAPWCIGNFPQAARADGFLRPWIQRSQGINDQALIAFFSLRRYAVLRLRLKLIWFRIIVAFVP